MNYFDYQRKKRVGRPDPGWKKCQDNHREKLIINNIPKDAILVRYDEKGYPIYVDGGIV